MTTPPLTRTEIGGHPVAGLMHLAVIYVVWGSTYLAIRVAVREGAGFGPFWLGASRVLVASVLLLAVARWRGRRIRPSGSELLLLAGSGLLLWVGGNGGVNWSEQRIDSSLAALVVGTMPMWTALLDSVIDRRRPSPSLVAGLVIGFLGLTVLTWPLVRDRATGDLLGVAGVLVASISWGSGSVLQRRRKVALGPIASSAWQQLCGGLGFVVVALAVAEPLPAPTPTATAAWAYLVVFGSIIAFTSFVTALTLLPTPVVMTYTYANPVIAVLLGWWLLDEPITGWTVAGTLLIVVGVACVFRRP